MTRFPIPELSIVIPAYNEESRIVPTLQQIYDFVGSVLGDFEVIVVDDGSTDRTAELVLAFASDHPRTRLISNDRNRGKGYSVRHGALSAQHKFVLFTDADNSTPIQQVEKLAGFVTTRSLVIASRALAGSRLKIKQPWYRTLMGRTFRLIVQGMVVPGIQDTQCGFKLAGRDVVDAVFPRMQVEGFAFDVELIARTLRLGFDVHEVAVDWADDPRSSVSPVRDSARMFRDVVKIWWRLRQQP
jgi:dolichyl-phosphate beta-glucosyltransferase